MLDKLCKCGHYYSTHNAWRPFKRYCVLTTCDCTEFKEEVKA